MNGRVRVADITGLTDLPTAVVDLVAALAGSAAVAATVVDPLDRDRRDPRVLAVARQVVDGEAAGPVALSVVPDMRRVLDAIHRAWWSALSDADRLAVVVAGAVREGRGLVKLATVELACSLAGVDEIFPTWSTVTAGRIRVDEHGQWIAETGHGGTTLAVGVYGSLPQAQACVLAAIDRRREDLAARMREVGGPLAELTKLQWEPPDVQVLATGEQQASGLDTNRVAAAEIAQRHGVDRKVVRQWVRSEGFPPPLPGTKVWRWHEVAQWTGENTGDGYEVRRGDM